MRSHVAHEIGRRHAGVGQISLESLCRVVPCNVHCMPTLPRPQHREQTAASAECVAHSGVGSPQAAARARSGGCVDLGDTCLAGASRRFVARRNSVRTPSSARHNRSDDASCAYEAQCFASSGLKRPSILCVVPPISCWMRSRTTAVWQRPGRVQVRGAPVADVARLCGAGDAAFGLLHTLSKRCVRLAQEHAQLQTKVGSRVSSAALTWLASALCDRRIRLPPASRFPQTLLQRLALEIRHGRAAILAFLV